MSARAAIALVVACAQLACAHTPFLDARRTTTQPTERARLALLAWILLEYPMTHRGYNTLRRGLMRAGVAEPELRALVQQDEDNLGRWAQAATLGGATSDQVRAAISFAARLRVSRPAWRRHADSGVNDAQQAKVVGFSIGAAVLVFVEVMMIMGGAKEGIIAPMLRGYAEVKGGSEGAAITAMLDQQRAVNNQLQATRARMDQIVADAYAREWTRKHAGARPGSTQPAASQTQARNAAALRAADAQREQARAAETARQEAARAAEAERVAQRQRAAQERQQHLQTCLRGASTATAPAFTTPFSYNLFGHAKMEASMCGESWTSVCWPKVRALLPDVASLAHQVAEIHTRYSALGLSTSCPVADLNAETVRQVRFWCGNLKKDCAPQIERAERVLDSANKAAHCAWVAGVQGNRRDECTRQFGP